MQARSLLFTLYGDFIQRYGSEAWIGTIIQALQQLGHSSQAVRMAVSRATQDGLLRGRRVGNRSYYSLTEKGRRRLEEGVRRVYRQTEEPWDRMWRFLTLRGPDSREVRDQFRLELTWAGFAAMTPTSWLSPRTPEDVVLAIAREHGIEDHVHVFSGRYAGPGSDQELVARCWDLAAIAERYEEFLGRVQERLGPLRTELPGGEVPDSRCFTERMWLVHEYRKFLHLDPGLPRELLPENWPGDRARELFWEYYRLLSSGAERFFLNIYRVAPMPGPLPMDGSPPVSHGGGQSDGRPDRRLRSSRLPDRTGW